MSDVERTEKKREDDGHLVEVMREKWRTARLARFFCVLASSSPSFLLLLRLLNSFYFPPISSQTLASSMEREDEEVSCFFSIVRQS